MTRTVAEHLLDRLREWGVQQVSGCPGTASTACCRVGPDAGVGTLRAVPARPGGRRLPELWHVEWFADHARLEPLLVDGAPAVRDGALEVPTGPGHGMTLRPDADRWRLPWRVVRDAPALRLSMTKKEQDS
jgi:L-alanine-DL-glutamate epimerase-like enolase superfamily enzyme